ncbi:MAG: DUF1707 domain-containing protein [Arachnia sp.]
MSEPDVPMNRLRAGDQDRDRALTALQQAYEAGRLDLEEMHERQELALRAKFADDLLPLLADLPEGQDLAVSQASPPAAAHHTLPATAPADGGFSLSVMSGRDVVVEPGTEQLGNFAWWGGNNYDLTRAMGPGRVITMSLHAIMGGNNIVVPPGVRVVDQSLAIMAGNEIESSAQGDGSNGTLVLQGFLFWAGNKVSLTREDR